jgi:hypothetical protein
MHGLHEASRIVVSDFTKGELTVNLMQSPGTLVFDPTLYQTKKFIPGIITHKTILLMDAISPSAM